MKTIEIITHVGEDRKLALQLPADIPPGDHRVIVVIEEATAPPRAPLTFSAHEVGCWPEGFTVRREEIYGDGR